MALGDSGNQNKKNYDPVVISRLKFKEENGKKELAFKMGNGLLQVIIQTYEQGSGYNEICKIYLSVMKSRILANEIKTFLTLPDTATTTTSFGTTTGFGEERGIVYIRNAEGSTEKEPKRVLVIGTVDKNGNLKESCDFAFNSNYHYGVEFPEDEIKEFAPTYFNDIEIDVLTDLLEMFSQNVSGVVAYTGIDYGRFDASRINTKLDLLMEKAGIEKKSGNYSRSSGGDSYFDKKGGVANSQYSNRARSSSTTIEDMESMIDD